MSKLAVCRRDDLSWAGTERRKSTSISSGMFEADTMFLVVACLRFSESAKVSSCFRQLAFSRTRLS
jgi:hypothetical protein